MASAQGAATFSVIAKDAASSVLKGVGKEMGKLGKTGGAVFKTLAATAAAVGAALTAAAAASLKLARAAISAAIEDDAEQQKLIATLKARGLNTEEATKRVNELIAAGQKLAFTDSEVRAGYATATQFAKGYAKQQAILAAAQNLARAKNISLEQATKLVGKAFIGSGAALKNYGVDLKRTVTTVEKKIKRDRDGNEVVDRQIKQTKEVIKGLEAVALIDKQFGGVAEAYSKTFAGQFDIVKDSINETVEAIGYAIGGGEGLPTFVRLLEGIRPVLDDVLGEINKNLPDIQRFGRELVEKFLAKLPGYVATAKRELPILIDNIKNFIGGVGGFAKDVASFLGPEGLITAGIAALGGKMGGLGGALGATFAAEFIKLGVDPITATITGTLAGAITAGVVQGFASSAAQAAVSKFLGLFKTVPITPSIPVGGVPGTPVGPTVVPGGNKGGGILPFLGKAAVALPIVGLILGEAERVWAENAAREKEKRAAAPGTFEEVKKIWSSRIPTLEESLKQSTQTGVVEGFKMTPPIAPINLTNDLTVTLDGAVLARNIDRRLGQNLRAGTPRSGGR
jgi:hypothetical protein